MGTPEIGWLQLHCIASLAAVARKAIGSYRRERVAHDATVFAWPCCSALAWTAATPYPFGSLSTGVTAE